MVRSAFDECNMGESGRFQACLSGSSEVQLEDDLFLEEEGNVVDSFVGKVYQRRHPTRQVTEGNVS
jgi:hypothetical protein